MTQPHTMRVEGRGRWVARVHLDDGTTLYLGRMRGPFGPPQARAPFKRRTVRERMWSDLDDSRFTATGYVSSPRAHRMGRQAVDLLDDAARANVVRVDVVYVATKIGG